MATVVVMVVTIATVFWICYQQGGTKLNVPVS